MIGTRYKVGSMVLLTYDSTAVGTVYSNSATSSTITGCWVEINNSVFTNQITPAVSKTYASTSYYASTVSDEGATWYFMSVKPESWYQPWRIRFKIHSFCPTHLNANSTS